MGTQTAAALRQALCDVDAFPSLKALHLALSRAGDKAKPGNDFIKALVAGAREGDTPLMTWALETLILAGFELNDEGGDPLLEAVRSGILSSLVRLDLMDSRVYHVRRLRAAALEGDVIKLKVE
jgi:hypothetical protein